MPRHRRLRPLSMMAGPAIAASFAIAVPSAAQDALSSGIVVTGISPKQGASAVHVAMAPTANGQAARWAGRLCLKIIGVAPEQSAFFAEKLSGVGKDLGLTMSVKPPCVGEATIAFTDDVTGFLDTMHKMRPRFLGTSAEEAALRASTAPVRWRAYASLRGSEGELPVMRKVEKDNKPGDASSERSVPGFEQFAPSRLSGGSRMDMQGMFVLVDTNRLQGASNGALAAYLAMIVFGNVRELVAPLNERSILNLFFQADPDIVGSDLTHWDYAFLKAEYSGRWNTSFTLRSDQVASSVSRALKSGSSKDGLSIAPGDSADANTPK